MITEKELLKYMEKETIRPLKRKELVKDFNISSEERPLFRKLLKEMVKKGALIKTRSRCYGLPEKMNLLRGTLHGHPDGFGFVIPEKQNNQSDKAQVDIYINPRNMKTAMHGDKVVCRVESRGFKNRKEGRIIRILERGHTKLVGIFERAGNFAFVIPNERKISKDIYIPNNMTANSKRGQAVVVEITQYPGSGLNLAGKIIENLGYPDNPKVEVEMIIRKHDLPQKFPDKVFEEADEISSEICDAEISKRKDCRDLLTVTIDGEKAKDFDDAISIEKIDTDNYRLFVHIADVSYYVKEDSPLNKEAYQRGTSVYFLDRVIPMLPQKLSNEICSLKPKKDRLTVTVEMEFNKKGELVSYDIYNSVINSNERMTYTDVAKILDNSDKELLKKYKHLVNNFLLMKELCFILNKKREELGSIDFDLPESDIVLNQEGRIENILRADRNISHKIIEEFMLSANVVAAKHISNCGAPGIYRIHDEPNPDKIDDFVDFIHNFGYTIENPKSLVAKSLQKLLFSARDKPEKKLINHVLLRSMKQAVYSDDNSGHFCLGFDCYTHFTSPIRRYPDLITHRILKELLTRKKLSEKRIEFLKSNLSEIAEHASHRERIATEAEREIINLNKTHFMVDKIGNEYSGFITGVASYGIFVELEHFFVEGLAHVSSMNDDYYVYHEKKHSLIGEHKRKIYRIGDKVNVTVENVSIEKRQIDFVL